MDDIKARIAKLRENNLRPFGYDRHHLEFESSIDEKEFLDVENKYSVKFPEEYRLFLTNVANGGAGPGYGLFRLNEAIAYQRNIVPKDILSKPFDHVGTFIPQQDPDIQHLYELCDQGLISNAELDSELEKRLCYIASGTVVLCDEGCGYLHRLVVNGPAKGEVWLDALNSDQGYHSLGVNFMEWYLKWLIDVEKGGSGTWWLQKL